MTEPRYSPGRLFLVALTFILLAPVFWQLTELRPTEMPDGPRNSDLYRWYYPAMQYAFGRLAQGEIPLWNPQQLCGMPLHTDARIGLWQPLNLVFAVMPTERAMAVQAFSCLTLMGLGTALFLRAAGVSYAAALFGGIAFAFCGASAGAMSRPPTAATLAWAPFALWAVTEYQTTFRLAMALVAGLFAALLVLGGSYAIAACFGLLLAGYAVYATVFPFGYDPPSLSPRIGAMFLALVTAIAVSAIQWLPTFFWANTVEHGSALVWQLDLAAPTPALPSDLLSQLFQSVPANLPRLGYLGVATLPFIPAALLHREGRRPAWFFAAATPLAWALFLYGDSFTPAGFPREAFIFPAALSTAALAGLGLDTLTTPGERYSLARLAPPTVLIALAAVGLFVIANGLVRGLLIVIAIIVVVYLFVRTRWASVACALLLACILFADLARANTNRFRHPFDNAPECYARYAPMIETARSQALAARVALSALPQDIALPANTGFLASIRAIGGSNMMLTQEQRIWWERMTGISNAAEPADVDTLQPGAPGAALINFMSTHTVAVVPDGPLFEGKWLASGPTLRLARTAGSGRIFLNEASLPRAYWVPAVRTAGTIDEAIDTLLDPNFDPNRLIVADRRTPGLVRLGSEILSLVAEDGSLPANSRTESACTVEEQSPEVVTVRLQAPTVGMLVLTDTFAPGWVADVDGDSRVVIRANGLFRAVHVPAGEHVITFRYRPVPFYVGAATTAVSLLILAGAAIVTIGRALVPKRRRSPLAPPSELE